ncbi:MAG TPA: HD domain-containing phosphohydrolase [Bradyrhizobium sp.]|nr:HD domain-containing phosphohydrolase [Bradyrhizobium sp.]
MRVHVIGDSPAKISTLRTMLERQFAITSEPISDAQIRDGNVDAVLVAADLRVVDNIAAIKQFGRRLSRIAKRIFVLDHDSRLSTVQAYALGATGVLPAPIDHAQLLAKLVDRTFVGASGTMSPSVQEAAAAGAACIASMFSAVLSKTPIDFKDIKGTGRKIADSVAEGGLSNWLATVRRHHEGTYQHCLLVTGVTVDFGMSLGLARDDLERLYLAAMLHDIGKATIPLAILEKEDCIEGRERALFETHPLAGYVALKRTPGISPELLDAVMHHHEYLDGSGYPDALGARSIPDLVRILTIADIFSALIEHRRHKPTMSRQQAYKAIQRMKGKLEEPLVAAFKEVALTR